MKKPNCEKNRLEFLKKPISSVRFISLKSKKLNQTQTEKTRKKPSQTETKPIRNYKIHPKKQYSFWFLI
jgi:hypothetical protein